MTECGVVLRCTSQLAFTLVPLLGSTASNALASCASGSNGNCSGGLMWSAAVTTACRSLQIWFSAAPGMVVAFNNAVRSCYAVSLCKLDRHSRLRARKSSRLDMVKLDVHVLRRQLLPLS